MISKANSKSTQENILKNRVMVNSPKTPRKMIIKKVTSQKKKNLPANSMKSPTTAKSTSPALI